MSKEADQTQQATHENQTKAPVTIHTQYIRDLSFENPNAPNSLRNSGKAPQLDINIGMDARKLEMAESEESFYEVVLNARAIATNDKDPVFVAELQYGVTVSLDKDFPEESHHPFLLIEVPRLAFPYVRQILADMTMQGGFPPLMLNPVDFQALYMEQFGDKIEEARKKFAEEKAGETVN